jgi:hypothetical protein
MMRVIGPGFLSDFRGLLPGIFALLKKLFAEVDIALNWVPRAVGQGLLSDFRDLTPEDLIHGRLEWTLNNKFSALELIEPIGLFELICVYFA